MKTSRGQYRLLLFLCRGCPARRDAGVMAAGAADVDGASRVLELTFGSGMRARMQRCGQGARVSMGEPPPAVAAAAPPRHSHGRGACVATAGSALGRRRRPRQLRNNVTKWLRCWAILHIISMHS